jgi:hypothetical protein
MGWYQIFQESKAERMEEELQKNRGGKQMSILCCDVCGSVNGKLKRFMSSTFCENCTPKSEGTPKTLNEAIRIGFNNAVGKSIEKAAIAMEDSVRDFLAQRSFAEPEKHDIWCEMFHKVFGKKS